MATMSLVINKENRPDPALMVGLVRASLECLASALPAGARVILFGSRGRGDARPDSDVDLLVIEQNLVSPSAEMVRLATLLGRQLIPADVVVMSRAAFEEQRMLPNTLAWRAANEGREYEVAL